MFIFLSCISSSRVLNYSNTNLRVRARLYIVLCMPMESRLPDSEQYLMVQQQINLGSQRGLPEQTRPLIQSRSRSTRIFRQAQRRNPTRKSGAVRARLCAKNDSDLRIRPKTLAACASSWLRCTDRRASNLMDPSATLRAGAYVPRPEQEQHDPCSDTGTGRKG